MNLSEHFTLEELTLSQAAARNGLDNRPHADEVENLRRLCRYVLEPLRVRLGRPIVVSSGFRSEAVNRLAGGTKTSQHRLGQAADFIVPGMTVQRTINSIREYGLPFDQLIDEFDRWVHVSYGPRNRGDVLIARYERGKTIYRRMTL